MCVNVLYACSLSRSLARSLSVHMHTYVYNYIIYVRRASRTHLLVVQAVHIYSPLWYMSPLTHQNIDARSYAHVRSHVQICITHKHITYKLFSLLQLACIVLYKLIVLLQLVGGKCLPSSGVFADIPDFPPGDVCMHTRMCELIFLYACRHVHSGTSQVHVHPDHLSSFLVLKSLVNVVAALCWVDSFGNIKTNTLAEDAQFQVLRVYIHP
jgi:hypothetical protein